MDLTQIHTSNVAGGGIVPTGAILPFASVIEPTGWLICDGRAISRTNYPDLFATIGTNWGSGDGSSTFNIPDLRGAFLRGTGTAGVSNDYVGPPIGDYQDDQNASHSHGGATGENGSHTHSAGSNGSHGGHSGGISGGHAGSGWYNGGSQFGLGHWGGDHSHSISTAGNHSHSISSDGGPEGRPYNRGVQYCIKY